MTVFSLALAVANLVSSGDKTHNFTAAECPMSVETEYHTDRTSGPMGTIFCCFLKLPFDAGISSSKVSSAQLLLNCLKQKVSLNFLGGVSNAVFCSVDGGGGGSGGGETVACCVCGGDGADAGVVGADGGGGGNEGVVVEAAAVAGTFFAASTALGLSGFGGGCGCLMFFAGCLTAGAHPIGSSAVLFCAYIGVDAKE